MGGRCRARSAPGGRCAGECRGDGAGEERLVRIDVAYEGGLHTRVTHGPSGSTLETDAPVDNEGRGEAFSPTDLVAAALGSCVLTVMGIVARRRGVGLEGARARVVKHMAAAPLRRIGRLEVDVELPPGLPATEREVLERAAHTCPVKASLHPETEVVLRFSEAPVPAGA